LHRPQLLRIIPCLLLHQGGLYKTIRFKKSRYIGDPINAVKIFNEKEADELLIVDIDATVAGRPPCFDAVKDIVSEAFMPVGYGGGISSLKEMETLFSCGVEKVSISAAALENPNLINLAVRNFGSQSVVVTIDVGRPMFSRCYSVYSHNAKRRWPLTPESWLARVEALGAGEVVVNNIDRDGTMDGYDHELLRRLTDVSTIPIIALGGASDYADMERAIVESNASAAAAGSLFVYRGKGQGVLINYPERAMNPVQ
jgi:imidazole glycerol-phosphate synthase subunit HisF